MWTPAREIKWVKTALKKEYLYSDEELIRMKRRLRDLYKIKYDMNKGDGFGNGSAPVIDLTQESLQNEADEVAETIIQLDKTSF